MKRYSRKKLIELCERAVVHHTKWRDRDSHCAQKNIQSIYLGLTAGLKFKIDHDTDDHTIWIRFPAPIDLGRLNNGLYLSISSIEEYREDCDPEYESEMFEGYGFDWRGNGESGYIPTENRLNNSDGEDWY